MRNLYEVAADIRREWKKVYFGAEPYLDAMASMVSAKDAYGMDSGKSIVTYFLANATTFRGPAARLLKAELKEMVK